MLDYLAPIWPGRICAVGRARPARLPADRNFITCDLANTIQLAEAVARILGGPPVAGLICVAGMDCRAGLDDVTSATFTASMQVNCFAHIRLLRAVARSRPAATRPLRVVIVSSDVGPPPPPRNGQAWPAPALSDAAEAVSKFITTDHATRAEEMWHA